MDQNGTDGLINGFPQNPNFGDQLDLLGSIIVTIGDVIQTTGIAMEIDLGSKPEESGEKIAGSEPDLGGALGLISAISYYGW